MHVSDVSRRTCCSKGIRHMIRLLLQGRTPIRFGRINRGHVIVGKLCGGNPVFYLFKMLHSPFGFDFVNA